MKKIAWVLGLLFLLTACGTAASEETGKPTDSQTESASETVGGTESEDSGKETGQTPRPVKTTYDPEYKVIQTDLTDYSVGTFVAAYDVLDYGVDPTGKKDCTQTVQKLIDKLGSLGGGVIYFPDGLYRFNKSLTLRKGVTLRGEWAKPKAGEAIRGTVFLVYYGKNKTIKSLPFIQMETNGGVMDLSIFYPEQDPNEIVPYAPAITMGVDGYWGNEYNNVKNVTFVNAYIGVHYSYTNMGASPVVNGVYGSPLAIGVEVDNIADVGRVEYMDLSPEYWIGCGLYARMDLEDPFKNEAAKNAVRQFIYENGVGLIMRRNDWSYSSYLTIEGYNKGYAGLYSVGSEGATPNGHNYAYRLKNCKTGISFEASSYTGIMFADIEITGCETGIWIAPGTADTVQFTGCTIDADTAILVDASSTTRVLFNQSTVLRGEVRIEGGIFNATDCDFNNSKASAHLTIGTFGSANLTSNRFAGSMNVKNDSLYTVSIDDEVLYDLVDMPQYEYGTFGSQAKLPAKMDLFLVTDYGAVADKTKTDNTEAFRKALAAAEANGGGIVFVPAGHWRLNGAIVIPSGVELRGATDTSSIPHGEGTVLECYWGRDDLNAQAFISIQSKAGLRGVTINYPEQVWDSMDGGPAPYAWAVRGCGSDLYVINVGFRATYAAIDLFTNRCDRFYVDFVTGHMFNYGLSAGAGAVGGTFNNVMCNTIAYACGNESKFGSFPNSPKGDINPVYDYGYANLEFFTLGDLTDLRMYNCFNFGANKGIVLTTEGAGGPNGVSIGLGLDADVKAMYVTEDVSCDFVFINTQFVSLGSSDVYYIYSEGNNDFDITLFASDYWGGPNYGLHMGQSSGMLRLVGAHFHNPGNTAFAELEGGYVAVLGSGINSKDPLIKSGTSGHMFITIGGSVADAKGIKVTIDNWINNIGTARAFSEDNDILSAINRKAWKGSASHNSGSVSRAFDGNVSTRWDTAQVQQPGMYFQVDFGSELTFDTLILDLGTSTSDMAAKWSVYVSDDGKNWGNAIATGERGSGLIFFDTVSARYLRIEQSGTSGGYWSIHELYVCELPS
ncbi:MAG: discoidin domain-containing protein [Clostridia bacterium]|nr:discoidin domain-containing protein [Clostridia bacterium]